MNLDNMRTLYSQLSRLPDEKFYMGHWMLHRDLNDDYEKEIFIGRSCDTVGCGAGWAKFLNYNSEPDIQGIKDPYCWAKLWLDLSERQADHLFYGRFKGEEPMSSITRKEFLEAMEEMAGVPLATTDYQTIKDLK